MHGPSYRGLGVGEDCEPPTSLSLNLKSPHGPIYGIELGGKALPVTAQGENLLLQPPSVCHEQAAPTLPSSSRRPSIQIAPWALSLLAWPTGEWCMSPYRRPRCLNQGGSAGRPTLPVSATHTPLLLLHCPSESCRPNGGPAPPLVCGLEGCCSPLKDDPTEVALVGTPLLGLERFTWAKGGCRSGARREGRHLLSEYLLGAPTVLGPGI